MCVVMLLPPSRHPSRDVVLFAGRIPKKEVTSVTFFKTKVSPRAPEIGRGWPCCIAAAVAVSWANVSKRRTSGRNISEGATNDPWRASCKIRVATDFYFQRKLLRGKFHQRRLQRMPRMNERRGQEKWKPWKIINTRALHLSRTGGPIHDEAQIIDCFASAIWIHTCVKIIW
jgi:hypothetical protein